MTEPYRLRKGEGYGACADEVVSKCALHRGRIVGAFILNPPTRATATPVR